MSEQKADRVCIRCSAAAESCCGRCSLVSYCSRQCQLADWQTHKITCLDSVTGATVTQTKYKKFIEHVNARLLGNIFILIAHAQVADDVVVHAQIDETIEEFAGRAGEGSSLHFAHLHLAHDDLYRDKHLNIVYKLKNYTQTITVDRPVDLAQVKNKYVAPPEQWSVFFEI